jgi:single-stranded DNA-binding protein
VPTGTDRTGIAPYLQRGQQVYVEGNPEARAFTRNDGTNGATLSLRVREVQLVGRKMKVEAATLVATTHPVVARKFSQQHQPV